MRTLKNFLTTKHAFVAEGLARTLPGAVGTIVTAPCDTAVVKKETVAGTHLKNIALFFAAPFIGLAYIMAFPLVGLFMLVWLAGKALLANKTTRPIVLAIAAPFVTIAFVTVGPWVGLGALAWIGGRALLKT
jgi:hypothetical protein